MIIHAALRFIVIECSERGLIDVNGVGIQQVHELGSGIVRSTAIVSNKQVTSYRKWRKAKKIEGTEEAYLPAISSNTSLAVEGPPLNGIAEEPLAGAEGEDEGAALFI